MYKPLEEISATCTEEDQPIFRNVKHALHVAFLMEVIDFHAKSNLRRLIEIAAQKYGIDEPQVRSVNWGRMTDMEKKATGAMIRCTCQRLLPESLFFFCCRKVQPCVAAEGSGDCILCGKSFPFLQNTG